MPSAVLHDAGASLYIVECGKFHCSRACLMRVAVLVLQHQKQNSRISINSLVVSKHGSLSFLSTIDHTSFILAPVTIKRRK